MSKRNSLAMIQKTVKKIKLVPPDGGWGWMVLIGIALTNIFNQSMLSLFSLLYGDAIERMGYNTSGAAVVLSTMLFVTNFGGPIAGALVKLTSPRIVAVSGACCCTAGLFISGFSTNLMHLVISYGVLLGLGLGFIQNSSFVAINAYFTSKKGRAVGLANVGTGVGQTLMPHVVQYFLNKYEFRGACLMLSGLSLHGIAGTLLIQPVKKHMKKIEEEVVIDETARLLDENNEISTTNKEFNNGDVNITSRRATVPTILNGNEMEKSPSKTVSQSHKELHVENTSNIRENPKESKIVELPKEKKTLLRKIYDLFDISLLSSPRFLNIIIGTALTVTSVQNFSMLFPLFLQKVANMDKQQTATCMSVVAIADIAGRLILPVFQDKYKIKARVMIIWTSVWLIIVRQILAYQTELTVLIVMSALYGFGRSMIIVARNIAISEDCRMEQVPAAVGLGMLSMGIIVPPAGYFLGWIRDYTGSYIVCITAQNALLVLFLIMWIPDMLLIWYQEKMQKKLDNKEQVELS